MHTHWTWLETWMAREFPALLATLNAGVDPAVWNELEAEIGVPLPTAFKDFYAVHDGQHSTNPTGFFFGLNFLSSRDVYSQWRGWRTIIQQEGEAWITEMSEGGVSLHPGKVKPLYANLRWIPIAYDWGGNHIGIDLDPDLEGTMGQVINFGRDEEYKFVLAPSFEAFIAWMVGELEAGRYVISSNTSDGHTDFGLQAHPETHFTDAARRVFTSFEPK